MRQTMAVVGVESILAVAVAKALAQEHKVRAVALRPPSALTLTLTAWPDVKLVADVDVEDAAALAAAIKGCDGCFVSTTSDFSTAEGYETELRHGRTITDACITAHIRHVVLNTNLSPVRTLGIRARHLDVKAEIEYYMKQRALPLTCIIVPCLYQELLQPPLAPKRLDDFYYTFDIPMGDTPLDMMAADDVGGVVLDIFRQGAPYNCKTLSLTGSKVTVDELAAMFSAHLQPNLFVDQKLTVQQYQQLGFAGALDYGYMFDFYRRVDQRASVDQTRKLYSDLQSLEVWLKQNADIVREALTYATPTVCIRWSPAASHAASPATSASSARR